MYTILDVHVHMRIIIITIKVLYDLIIPVKYGYLHTLTRFWYIELKNKSVLVGTQQQIVSGPDV